MTRIWNAFVTSGLIYNGYAIFKEHQEKQKEKT